MTPSVHTPTAVPPLSSEERKRLLNKLASAQCIHRFDPSQIQDKSTLEAVNNAVERLSTSTKAAHEAVVSKARAWDASNYKREVYLDTKASTDEGFFAHSTHHHPPGSPAHEKKLELREMEADADELEEAAYRADAALDAALVAFERAHAEVEVIIRRMSSASPSSPVRGDASTAGPHQVAPGEAGTGAIQLDDAEKKPRSTMCEVPASRSERVAPKRSASLVASVAGGGI